MARLRVLSAGAALAAAPALAPSIALASGAVVPETYPGKTFSISKTDVWSVGDSGRTTIITNTFTIDGTLTAAGFGTKGIVSGSGPTPGGGAGSADGTVPGGGGGLIKNGGTGNLLGDAGMCSPVTGAE